MGQLTESEVNAIAQEVYSDAIDIFAAEDVVGPFSNAAIDLELARQDDEDDDAAYDFETISSTWAKECAEKQGLDIVLPFPDQLQIDIDNDADYLAFHANLKKFQLHVGHVTLHEDNPSKSGDPGKRHLTLKFERSLEPLERILFQLFLGSDRTRELLSYIRYINDDENPTLFYEKRRLLLKA